MGVSSRGGGRTCRSCGRELSPATEGETCPDCLLRIGLPTPAGEVEVDGYEIIERLGEGGMGEVYLAEQRSPVTRMVALKVIKLGMDTRSLVKRFGSERQALALMDHPNIAAVYDAGATAAGRPYFAMEWVDGVPIDEFCRKGELGVRERLELFITVASAVQHAHSKGIVHCDLKPSNVLVATGEGGQPVPKVIDFGVAKAVDPEAKLGQTRLTTGGQMQIVGTPAYMAPEQAEGSTQDVDARADVYSLGATLYELLCGQPPFDEATLTSGGLIEMLRVLREDEPARPSLRGAAGGGRIPGDLDWITMRAMAKDRERRYASPAQLADDVRRFLDDEPVQARPPSAVYQLKKFARRHRFAIAASGLVALALAVGAIVSTVQAVRAWQAEREAVAHRERGEKLVKLFVEELYGSLKDLGRLDLLAEVADAAAGYYDSLPADDSIESLIGRSDALSKIAEVMKEQGDHHNAARVAQMALAMIEAQAEAPGASTRLRFELSLRHSQTAMAVRKLEGAAASFPHLDRAIEIGHELVDLDDGDRSLYEGYLAGFYNIIGSSYQMAEDPVKSLEALGRARGLREGLLERFPDEVARQSDVAEIYGDIARVHGDIGEHDKGAKLIEEAVAIRRQIPLKRPGELRWAAHLASTCFDLGRFRGRAGELGAGLEALDEAIGIWRRLIRVEPRNANWRGSLAKCLQEKVGFAMELGREEEFLSAAKEALSIWVAIVGEVSGDREHLALLRSHLLYGRTLESVGELDAALEQFRLTVRRADRLLKAGRLTERSRRSAVVYKEFAQKRLRDLGG